MVLPSPGSTDRKNPIVHPTQKKGGGAEEKVTLNVEKGDNGVSGGGVKIKDPTHLYILDWEQSPVDDSRTARTMIRDIVP